MDDVTETSISKSHHSAVILKGFKLGFSFDALSNKLNGLRNIETPCIGSPGQVCYKLHNVSSGFASK